MQNTSHGFDFASDFYHEEDDTTRGVSLGPVTTLTRGGFGDMPDVDDNFWKNSSPLDMPMMPMPTLARAGANTENMAIATDWAGIEGASMTNSYTPAELDYSTVLPSPVPFGGCAATSVNFERVAPADVMKALHNFFQTDRAASISKMRLQKCSIIASVVVQDTNLLSSCVVKARIFWAEPTGQKLVVEFRRREGDPLAFQRVFARAVAWLRGAEPLLAEEPCTLPADVEIESLQPCVDMLAKAPSQAGQLESVIALAVLAQKSSKMAIAVTAAVAHLQGLLCTLEASPLFNVAYTTSLLTSRLVGGSAFEQIK
jgi:hypothetical protein